MLQPFLLLEGSYFQMSWRSGTGIRRAALVAGFVNTFPALNFVPVLYQTLIQRKGPRLIGGGGGIRNVFWHILCSA
jgi:hypothetical protein